MSYRTNADLVNGVSVQPLAITLRGITNDDVDPSVDTWRAVTFPLMRHVTGVEGGFELKIIRRGAAPKVQGGCECWGKA